MTTDTTNFSHAAPESLEVLTKRRRQGVLLICCMSLFIVGIDVTGVNLALPSISRELGATTAQLQWVIDAYTLVLASFLMLAGSTADRVGRKRMFRIGLVAFGIGSILCSVATSPAMLIGARVLQALGGSMLNPVAMSIITNTFREPKERARAIGVWGAFIGLSMALGPVVGGGLVELFSWRAVFWLNVPVVIAAFVLTTIYVPESRADRVRKLDPFAQILMVVLLASLTFAIIEGSGLGWTSAALLGLIVVAVAALVTLVWWERRRAEPLLDPRFFRSIPFCGAVVSAIVGFCAQAGFLFLNALYLQEVRGFSPFHAGLMTLPMAAALAICAPFAGRAVAAVGTRVPTVVASLGIGVSAVMLLQLEANTSLIYLTVAYLAFGIGFGSLNAPITNTAVSGMPRSQAGVASAIASTSRQVGTSLGAAILPAVVYAHLDGPVATSLATATHAGWWIMLGCAGALFVAAFVTTSAAAIRSRDRVAALLGE